MPINKVTANFHISPGKSIHHSRGHSHLAGSVPESAYNFSHRIARLSFAEDEKGAHTLDGETMIAAGSRMLYQYFLKIVPTTTLRLGQTRPFRSNQYSVLEQVLCFAILILAEYHG